MQEPDLNDTVIIPPVGGRRRRGGTFIPPLLAVSFIAYNIVAFLFFGGDAAAWNNKLFSIFMVSGGQWIITAGDLMLVVSLVFLFIELLKSTRTGSSSIVEHMLSMIVFVAFLIEFILVGAASCSVFFLLMVMSLIDVVAGFSVSITSAGRDVTMN
jgi:hypothetical protein